MGSTLGVDRFLREYLKFSSVDWAPFHC